MRLAFVYPPQEVCRIFYPEKIRRQYNREGAILPPLGIAYLAAILEKKHVVKIIEANALRLSLDEVIDQLRDFKPDALLFSLITTDFRPNLEWIKAIKKQIDVPVIVGGPQPSIYPTETLTYDEIDFCVVGEGWETLPELLDCVAGKGDYKSVKGIALKENGEIVLTEKRQAKLNINNVPFPARHLLPNESYTTILSKRRPITAIMSSSGCPFNCLYCGHSYDVILRDPVRVVDEMEECAKKYGIKEILFYDETFSLDKHRAAMICEELIKRKLDIACTIRTRADLVDELLVKLFARAGCIRISFGIESADPEALKWLRRNLSLPQIVDAVRWAKREKIDTLGFFMIGYPGESAQGIQKTIALAKQLDLDYVQINKLVTLPDTQLYTMFKEKTGKDLWRDYVLGKADFASFAPLNSKLTVEELDMWLKKAYRSFYFRPRYILNRLRNVTSFKEFCGLVNSALSLR
ncbi:MAG: B12-binding domain-containing radical SAM protein [Candidatus Omnitrophica bacterium]|nr:B12-binding domain-containing radical SAM protein [Candidatus Omnitrophota bacterium]